MAAPLILSVDDAAIAQAAATINAGACVAVPTETVYGLAADATSGAAVARIYAAKGRPSFNPLIVHVGSLDQAERFAEFSPVALRLAEAFWPGPLTLVLPARSGSPIASLVTAGLPTIAIRLPAHPTMRALIAASGRPLAAPSANASGRISATTAAHVAASLGERVALILDGGPTQHGLESTIVALTGERVRMLRPGPIDAAAIGHASGLPIASGETGKIEAPGQLSSHYAPGKPLRLDALDRREGEWLIGFGEVSGDDDLSKAGDLIEAAAALFGALHRADASPSATVAVAPIPEVGLGVAINDRLRRAAAPR